MKLLRFFKREPDVVVGDLKNPYLLRWHVIPRNKFFNIYLHKFLRSDDDRALHDHMYDNISILLKGEYIEITRTHGLTQYKAGDIIFRRAKKPHRILLDEGKPVWTLFFCGPRYREWGFHCPQGWRHWREFLDGDYTKGEQSVRGKGCN